MDSSSLNFLENKQYFFHKDHLGSSTQISDISANIIHHIEYMPYGEAFVEQRSNWGTNYKFNGKELDEETGYYYYGARYYTPDLSIWLSVDPLSDKYPSLSPYNYCANNPIKYVDPDGMRIVAVGEMSQYYVKSYLKEHFGNSRAFKVTNSGELVINQRKFDKQYKNASSDQRILMDGLKDAISREEVAKVQVNKSSDYFERTFLIPGTETENFIVYISSKEGFIDPPTKNFPEYFIGINDKRANSAPLSSDATRKIGKDDLIPIATGKSASSVFFHEVLDEFLNNFINKNINANSSKKDEVLYHNAALRNIGKIERNALDH